MTTRRTGLWLTVILLGLIAIGTVLLMLPAASAPGRAIGWGDALFTSTSSATVTGLTVRDTAAQFSPFGQIVIAIMMQAGGLTVMIVGSLLIVRLLRALGHAPAGRSAGLVRFIIVTTITVELLGAMLLYPLWHDDAGDRLGLSLFHSVSAFCNGGFDLLGDSFVGYRDAPAMQGVIGLLVVLGGIGFPVLFELYRTARRRTGRLSGHARLVLATTAGAYLLGVALIGASQLAPYYHEALQQGVTANAQRPGEMTPRDAGGILADAGFLSISARSAGFTTTPMDRIEPGGRFALMVLMCVGGSFGSAAGGATVAVVGVLILTAIANLRRRPRDRVTDALASKAAAMALGYIVLIAAAAFLLSLSEPFAFETVLFESISAATTTGLSLGVTSDLTAFGKAVMMACMFLGRVGPLVLLSTLLYDIPNPDDEDTPA